MSQSAQLGLKIMRRRLFAAFIVLTLDYHKRVSDESNSALCSCDFSPDFPVRVNVK